LKIKNVELKAKTNVPKLAREILENLNAKYIGCDNQVDTYFNTSNGRIKLREGNIENSLIHYKRENSKEAKVSDIAYSKVENSENIKHVLSSCYGILIEVVKKRHIYFIDHVKFHIDYLDNLGTFIEIEVIDEKGEYSINEMNKLCVKYQYILGIKEPDLLTHSYSDMLNI
jgi:predicted adenylyl cyclase CyaB